ncbi:S-adenosyl-L-methionine-dependent methyltransferase [Bisporella sp. PMI_857]|nr:S-adenosyl-L-methionine-dependent methyltransferase [Bisporella sp. PMI_857]
MSQEEQTTSGAAPLDPTFRNYDSQQAATYASHRGSYSSDIYKEVLEYHDSHGGEFDTVLDTGCGTGKATRSLAQHFSHAIGLDPGKEMIKQAQMIGGKSKGNHQIEYENLGAEELDRSTLVAAGSVDLLTAAMAAHLFHMEDFWPQAARMVKPGGTVALWTHSSLYCHPSTPNAAGVQKAFRYLEDEVLSPYELPSSKISHTMYQGLIMPWSVSGCGIEFPESSFVRREWDRDGALEPGKDDFFGSSREFTLQQLSDSLGTSSMVTRWREDNPALLGTGDDCVVLTMKAVATALGKQEQNPDEIKIRVGSSTTLLLFTRAKDRTKE